MLSCRRIGLGWSLPALGRWTLIQSLLNKPWNGLTTGVVWQTGSGHVDEGLMSTFRSDFAACRHRVTAEFTEPSSAPVQVETHICILPRNFFACLASALARNTAKPKHVSQHCPPSSTDEMGVSGTCSSIACPAKPTSRHSHCVGIPPQGISQG